MKLVFSILSIFCALLFAISPAHGQGLNQKDSLVISVINKDTGESLSGVTLNYLHSSVAAITNEKGIAVLPKYLYKKIITSIAGFESDTLTLSLIESDTLTIGMEKLPVYSSADLHEDIMESAIEKAQQDINKGSIQILHHILPTNEEVEFSKRYSFQFMHEKDKPRIFRISYNQQMIEYLKRIHGESFADSLGTLYNRNR